MLLAPILKRMITDGELTVIDHKGRKETFGSCETLNVKCTLRFHDAATPWRLIFNPNMAVGEGYMNGNLSIENGDIRDFLKIATYNMERGRKMPAHDLLFTIRRAVKLLQQYNPIGKAQQNVAHHYDLSGALYDLFLDRDKQYSCAYFSDDSVCLEQAQFDKKKHLAAKLLLEPNQRVLDIGSGWGGLGLYLAEQLGANVTGVTLSKEQLAIAQRRAKERNLAQKTEFRLQDYRHVSERFDRIVSVGMFEHVGVGHFGEFFGKVRDLLTDDGVAVIHSIGRFTPPTVTNPWIRKYIFPGGYMPSLSETLKSIEKSGLYVTDIEILRLHYADTALAWRERFLANIDRAKEIYDDRFCRMWEFYLAGAEMSFRHQHLMVFQIQLAKQIDSVPRTRDYMIDRERALPSFNTFMSDEAPTAPDDRGWQEPKHATG